MKFLLMLSLAGAVSLSAHANTIYTWTDEAGNIHLGDAPMNSDAKSMKLPDLEAAAPAPEVQSTTQPKMTKKPKKEEKKVVKKEKEELPKKLELTMISPTHDETLRSSRGFLSIQLESNRKLGIGEQIQLYLDGSRYGAPQSTLNWQLKNIDRGAHTIAVKATRSGKVIASTSPITVHLHRPTVK